MDNQTFISGKIKNYNQQKGFGFIVTKEYGDVFFHQRTLENGFLPIDRQAIWLEVTPSTKKQGSFEAVNVKPDFTPAPIETKPENPFYDGKVKFYDDDKGFGVITTQTKGEVFFHSSKLEQGYRPKEDDYVLVQITPSKKKVDAFDASFVKRDIINTFVNNTSAKEDIFNKLNEIQQNELLQMFQEKATEEQLFSIWYKDFDIKPSIVCLANGFIKAEKEERDKIFFKLSQTEKKEVLDLSREIIVGDNYSFKPKEITLKNGYKFKKGCEYIYEYICNFWKENSKGKYDKYAKWIIDNATMEYHDKLIEDNKTSLLYNLFFLHDIRVSENIYLPYKIYILYKSYSRIKFYAYDDNMKWLMENTVLDNLKNILNIVLGYNKSILQRIYKTFFPNQDELFFRKYENDWGLEKENEKLKAFSSLFLEEFKLKKNNLIKFRNNIKKNIHSATDLANFVFCPASYAINQIYEIDFSEQENVFIGTKEHSKQRLVGLSDKGKWAKYKNDEKYANFYKDFERIIKADVVSQGHKEEKPIVYYSKNKKIAGIPDYIFKDNAGHFVVEEKYTFKNQDKLTNIYPNHKMQALAYLYGIADFEFDEAYLVYWFVKKNDSNEGYQVDGYKIFKIFKTEENKKLLIDTFHKLESLQNRESIAFDNQNINYKKCVKCNYFPYCEYKKGDKNTIQLPVI